MSDSTFSSTKDIIKCADSWNLAKDVGLLQYLDQFSEKLIGDANKTKANLDKLMTELNNTHVNFNVVQNRFQSLHNTQFIESRVYEDDETLQSQEVLKKDDSQNLTENDKLKAMKNVIIRGVEVVDKYFDKVEVPGSDSEDEIDFPRFTLRAKDPYSDRPLPYVIGTEEWHKKWHVGLLEETSSESDDEKISNKESSSDSGDTLPVYRPQVLGTSETSSETELNKSHISLPVSTSDEIKKGSDKTADESDKNSFSSQAPIANSTFADQLAAKLGDVFDHNRNIEEPVINTRPIQKVPAPYKYRNMFPEEPPPLENDDDDLFNSGKVKTDDLFDDLDDNNSLWSNDPIKAQSSYKINKNNNSKTVGENKNNNKKNLDLFDDVDDEGSDDIFNTNPVIKNKKPLLIEQKSVTIPFFSGEPPDISAKKPSVGGSLLIKNDNNSINKENEKVTSSSNISTKETIDIFNDNANDLFDDDLFSNIETNKFTSNLFSNISDDVSSKNDLEDKIISSNSLFDSSLSKNTEIETEKEVTFEKSTTSKTGLSLFDDVNDDFDDLFLQDESKSNNNDSRPINEPKDQTSQNDKAIFNDIWPDEINEDNNKEVQNKNDLIEKIFEFNDPLPVNKNITSNVEKETDNNKFDEEANLNIKKDTAKNNLLRNTPPELDDDWDLTSDNNLFEDMFEKIPEIQPYKLGLFMSDEPPSLFPTLDNNFDDNERGQSEDVPKAPQDTDKETIKSEITGNAPNITSNLGFEEKTTENVLSPSEIIPQKLPGKLKHSLNINVNALLPPGARKRESKTSDTPKTNESELKQKQEDLKEEEQEHTPQRSTSFDDQVDGIKTLDSVTKNRVRAPVQRRPSTRKGRQQYLRNTDSNYTINMPETNDDTKQSLETIEPKTTETVESKEETVEEISTSKIEQKRSAGGLFDSSDSESDSELFSSSKLKINERRKQENVLDDGSALFKVESETDNDIFNVSSSTSIKRTEKKIESHKDLFGDDTDDDDLFFTSKSKRNEEGNRSVEKNQSDAKARVVTKGRNKSSIKKLDNEAKPVLDDPLNLLGG